MLKKIQVTQSLQVIAVVAGAEITVAVLLQSNVHCTSIISSSSSRSSSISYGSRFCFSLNLKVRHDPTQYHDNSSVSIVTGFYMNRTHLPYIVQTLLAYYCLRPDLYYCSIRIRLPFLCLYPSLSLSCARACVCACV